MGCVRPLGKSHQQRDRTGNYERDEYDYEYVEWDATTGELDGILQCDADELCARSGDKRHLTLWHYDRHSAGTGIVERDDPETWDWVYRLRMNPTVSRKKDEL